jgi:hypothetical protein
MLDQEFQQLKKAMRDEGVREGRDEGRREAMVTAILRIIDARKLAITDAERSRVLACTDPAQLDLWLERAVTAPSVRDVLDG